jgi:hypothetical protein
MARSRYCCFRRRLHGVVTIGAGLTRLAARAGKERRHPMSAIPTIGVGSMDKKSSR